MARWDELDGDSFAGEVTRSGGVCLVPLACIERHAHHLPLGTDLILARALCEQVAAIEPAIVFPELIFTQIFEAQPFPGTIAFDPDLLLRLLDNACREIARNGMDKIVLVNAHGGNTQLLRYFSQLQLATPRDYVVYVVEDNLISPEDVTALDELWDTTEDGHAGERETSCVLALRPDLVRPDQLVSDDEGHALGRLDHLRESGVSTGIWWYADHPSHYRGDGSFGSAAKGTTYLDARVRALTTAVRTIKADGTARELQDEFHRRRRH